MATLISCCNWKSRDYCSQFALWAARRRQWSSANPPLGWHAEPVFRFKSNANERVARTGNNAEHLAHFDTHVQRRRVVVFFRISICKRDHTRTFEHYFDATYVIFRLSAQIYDKCQTYFQASMADFLRLSWDAAAKMAVGKVIYVLLRCCQPFALVFRCFILHYTAQR